MKISTIKGNSQKLDGGAMHGNVPKALWTRWIEADSKNRIKLGCRALLVETGDHKILFETGIGAYMSPDMRTRFGIEKDHHVLLQSLSELNLTHQDITDIIVSHLHFDHAGGLLDTYAPGKQPDLLFPNATYHIGKDAFDRSENPHYRDRASFLPELNKLLRNSNRLHLLENHDQLTIGNITIDFFRSDGHTPGMLLSCIHFESETIFFAGDLIPGIPWIHIPVTMGYDRFPELLIDEKTEFLKRVIHENTWVFYTHDYHCALSKISLDQIKNKYHSNHMIDKFKRINPSDLNIINKERP